MIVLIDDRVGLISTGGFHDGGSWSSCRCHGRVELYLYPPFGPHPACNGKTLPFLFAFQVKKIKVNLRHNRVEACNSLLLC